MAKITSRPSPLTCYLALHQNEKTEQFKTYWIFFPMTKNDILSTKSQFWRCASLEKVGLFTNQQILSKKFCVTLTESFACWVIMSWLIQVNTIHTSSQLLSVWSISAHIQSVFEPICKNYIIYHQIDFVANFPLYILIEGSSQPLLVISQFFQFFAEMPHISAERHLSKISY